MKLVSACLIGVKCKYDGKSNFNKKIFKMFKKGELFPICPEVFAGLPVPREPITLTAPGSKILEGKGKVISKSGKDLTRNLKKSAEFILKICKSLRIKEAILKQRSPSCGCGETYINEKIREGDGILTALLKKNGIKCYSEEEI